MCRLKLIFFTILLSLFVGLPSVKAVPAIINYSGFIQDDGQPIDGDFYFKFAIISSLTNTTVWSNDGSSDCLELTTCEPDLSVLIVASDGRFSVKLGDSIHDNMTMPITPSLLANSNLALIIWYGEDRTAASFTRLTPDRQLASTPYSMVSEVANSLVGSSIVSGSMLVNDSVSSAKIVDDSITSADIADEAVAAADISAGAISNLHISSTANIDASKIDSTGLDADTLDGLDSGGFMLNSGGTLTGDLTAPAITSTGSVSAENFNYSTLKTKYLSVPGLAFKPVVATTTIGFCSDASTHSPTMTFNDSAISRSTLFYAPVYLPEGAVVTSLRYALMKSAAPSLTQSTAKFYRAVIGGINVTSTELASTVSLASDATGIQHYQYDNALAAPATIDNKNNIYFLEIDMVENDKYCLDAVRIEYTLSGL